MGRAPCSDTKRKNNGLKRGPWTPEEDKKLINYIQSNGYGNWRTLPKNAGLQRCGKSCRLRWTNYLRPDIKRGRFSLQEEDTIIYLHSILGNKWSAIASRLPGRTDNEIKNYWNTHIRKRLLRMGIDPVTHGLRLDLLDLSSIFNSSLHTNPSHIDFSTLIGTSVPSGSSNPDLMEHWFTPFSPSCDQAQISDVGVVDFNRLYPSINMINDGFNVQSLEDQTQGNANNLIANVINQDEYATSCNGFQNSEDSTFSNQISSFGSVFSSSSPATWNLSSNSDSPYITSGNEGEMLQQLIQV